MYLRQEFVFFWRKCVPDKRYLMQFKAATGFKVVLEFSGEASRL